MIKYLDKVEFFNLINNNDCDALWSAYEYAIHGGVEPPRGVFNGVNCHFCGSRNLIREDDNDVIVGRVGCLDCVKWLTPVRLIGGE